MTINRRELLAGTISGAGGLMLRNKYATAKEKTKAGYRGSFVEYIDALIVSNA
jgi:hypothetical protein